MSHHRKIGQRVSGFLLGYLQGFLWDFRQDFFRDSFGFLGCLPGFFQGLFPGFLRGLLSEFIQRITLMISPYRFPFHLHCVMAVPAKVPASFYCRQDSSLWVSFLETFRSILVLWAVHDRLAQRKITVPDAVHLLDELE